MIAKRGFWRELVRILVVHERLELHVSIATDNGISVATGDLVLM